MGTDKMPVGVDALEKLGPFLGNDAAGIGATGHPEIPDNVEQARRAMGHAILTP